ncbi:ribosome recycling factor family protein [Thalassotalea agariperforans]
MPLNTSIIQIILPSFLRRVMKAYALKAKIRELGGELNRIGRSRNWQLKANREQLEDIINTIESNQETSWQWVAKKLREHVTYTTFESLLQIAKNKPGITVNELMAKTDCTISQARKVIDEIEFSDD